MTVRPDGRTYRPRTPGLRVHAWENEGPPDDDHGCIVLGTLNPDGPARTLAHSSCAHWYGDAHRNNISAGTPGWWRKGYDRTGSAWISDECRGAPGVMYTWE